MKKKHNTTQNKSKQNKALKWFWVATSVREICTTYWHHFMYTISTFTTQNSMQHDSLSAAFRVIQATLTFEILTSSKQMTFRACLPVRNAVVNIHVELVFIDSMNKINLCGARLVNVYMFAFSILNIVWWFHEFFYDFFPTDYYI